MKKGIYILLLLLPLSSFAQWSQLGNFLSGQAPNDKLGTFNSIDISGDGTTLAVGSQFNSDNGQEGYAEVYELIGSQWIQRGNTIVGDSNTSGAGAAVSLSENGMTLAVGSPFGINSLGYRCGVVGVYDWNGSAWALRGGMIEGEGDPSPAFAGDIFGRAVDLSPDGNYLIVGGPSNTQQTGVLQLQGHARVYHWDGQAWTQMGQDLDGERSLEEYGLSVSINATGTVIAVGGRSYGGVAQEAGIVRTFEWDGQEWTPRGTPFLGMTAGDNLGSAVSLSKDGNTLAIGIPKANGFDGVTQVFDWNGTTWVQKGGDILGTSSSQSGTDLEINASGTVVGIGEPWASSANGRARVVQWDGTTWTQVGNTLQGVGSSTAINGYGSAVALNADGSRFVVGSPFHDIGSSSFNNEGRVYVYENITLVSLDQANQLEIRLFPNPTSSSVQLTSQSEIQEIVLFNMMGQQVMRTQPRTPSTILDLHQIPAGTYIVSIQTNETFKTIKLAKR